MYGEALLVIESNTLETEGTEGDNFEYILDEIAGHYDNLYSRTPIDQSDRVHLKDGDSIQTPLLNRWLLNITLRQSETGFILSVTNKPYSSMIPLNLKRMERLWVP